eukprot:404010_1
MKTPLRSQCRLLRHSQLTQICRLKSTGAMAGPHVPSYMSYQPGLPVMNDGVRTLERHVHKKQLEQFKPHPADGGEYTQPGPEHGYNTDWVDPKLPEYLQIRRRIRAESEDWMKRTWRRRKERVVASGQRNRSNFQDEFFHRPWASNRPEDEFKDSLETPLGMEVILQQLESYTGVDDPSTFMDSLRSLALRDAHWTSQEKNIYNEKTRARQAELIKRFDADAARLRREMENVRSELNGDEARLEDARIQECLRKWYILKVDFASKDAEAQLTEDFKQLTATASTAALANRKEKGDQADTPTAVHSSPSGPASLSEFERALEHMTTLHVPLSVATELLSGDSVDQLVRVMRSTVEGVHKMLLISEEDHFEALGESQYSGLDKIKATVIEDLHGTGNSTRPSIFANFSEIRGTRVANVCRATHTKKWPTNFGSLDARRWRPFRSTKRISDWRAFRCDSLGIPL